MNKKKWILLATVMVLFAAAGAFLHHRRTYQKLGKPGIIATPIAGSPRMEIDLPERVLNFVSETVPPSAQETNMLPQDTTIAKRRYVAPEVTNGITITVVMMGTDRTSIHKPKYCLNGQGWTIDKQEQVNIAIPSARGYELPAMRWSLSQSVKGENGKMVEYHAFYLFWFTADNEITGEHPFWRIMREVLLTGVLPRWSYVSYFCYFPPEAETEITARLTEFVAASAPEFQLPPAIRQSTNDIASLKGN